MGTRTRSVLSRVGVLCAGLALLTATGCPAVLTGGVTPTPTTKLPYPLVDTEGRLSGFRFGEYRLKGRLPESNPPAAESYVLESDFTKDGLRKLATALGMSSGTVRSRGHGWFIREGHYELWVNRRHGGLWEFGTWEADYADPDHSRPDNERATELAAPVFHAAGLDPGDARPELVDHPGSLIVNHSVSGLESYGLTTRVAVTDQKVVYATGWLRRPVSERSLTLHSARRAYERLRARMRQPPGGIRTCAPTGRRGSSLAIPACEYVDRQIELVGAKLGLAMDIDQDGNRQPRLVPAWLFEEDSYGPNQYIPYPAYDRSLPKPG